MHERSRPSLLIFLALSLCGGTGARELTIADFDGKTFTPDGEAIDFYRGNCFYA